MHSMEKSVKASRKLSLLTWTLIALLLWQWGKGCGNCEQRHNKRKKMDSSLCVERKVHEKEHSRITLERQVGAKLWECFGWHSWEVELCSLGTRSLGIPERLNHSFLYQQFLAHIRV